MATWTQNSTTKAWTLSAGAATAVIASSTWPGRRAIVLDCLDYNHHVKAVIYSSLDGNTCYEAGIQGANAIIRKRVLGTVVGTLTNQGSADVPAAGNPASVAHGLTSAVPFTMELREYEGLLEVWINGAIVIRHTVSDTDYSVLSVQMSDHRYYGFMSDVASAIVTAANISTLETGEPSQSVEVLVAVSDGDVYLSEDGQNVALIASGSFNSSGPVSLAEYQGSVYGVDGTSAKVINLQTRSVSNWTATAGTFPGSGGTAGKTTATIVSNYLDRLALSGDSSGVDSQNVYMTAIGTPTDFDTAAPEDGRAFALNAALPGRIGQPVTCLSQASKGVLLIGCVSSMWRFVGDPALGTPDVTPLSLTDGISGLFAATLASDGIMLVHSRSGMLVVNTAGDVVPLSHSSISSGITIDDPTDRVVVVQRDPGRMFTHAFLTHSAAPDSPESWWSYAEKVGGYQRTGAGFFEQRMASTDLEVTSACLFRGRPVFGTRNGRVCEFSDSATSDVDEAFDSRAQLALYKADNTLTDIELQSIEVVLDDASTGAELRVYGGRTAQEAATGTNRTLMVSEDISPYSQRVIRGVRHRALAVEMWGTSDTGRWAVEQVVALGVPCRTIGVMGVKSASLANASQAVPVAAADDTSDGGGAAGASIERLLVVSASGYAASNNSNAQASQMVYGEGGGRDPSGSSGGSMIGGTIIVPH